MLLDLLRLIVSYNTVNLLLWEILSYHAVLENQRTVKDSHNYCHWEQQAALYGHL